METTTSGGGVSPSGLHPQAHVPPQRRFLCTGTPEAPAGTAACGRICCEMTEDFRLLPFPAPPPVAASAAR
ncbi:unnamed protein product [Rangifer tarandus platyrhynchus]|uniref:Uncharacterized protein n=1 Tax=Rangifer tarandus platyrhynchus TaxID=3082113 RepID=A0ABN8Y4S6_RANTA|nr:unnamed protein product [Rangifer tarandus platyrhynchus]